MRLALVALILTLPAASSAEAPPSPAPRAAESAAAPSRAADSSVPSRICGMKPRLAESPEPVRPRSLGELPPGELTLAVVNRVGDCIEPVVIRQGVGGFDGRPGR